MSDKPLTDIPFSQFDLHSTLLAGLTAAGFLRCTPIQAMTLPFALAGTSAEELGPTSPDGRRGQSWRERVRRATRRRWPGRRQA